MQKPYKSRSAHKFCWSKLRLFPQRRSCCTKRRSIGAYKFRRTSNNTSFYDAHSKCSPCEIMPRRCRSYSGRAGGMRFTDAPRCCGVSASASSLKIALCSKNQIHELPKLETVATKQLLFDLNETGCWMWPGNKSVRILQTCKNTSRGYESDVIWRYWHLP
jgi:hypothetical protein